MAGIYVHIPFCRSKCLYCDFYSETDLGMRVPVLEGILRELGTERGFIGDVTINTIYIGGGTPSVLAPMQLQQIVDRVRSLWFCSTEMEITVECNPDDLTPDYLERLNNTDVNRLSIGIQSFCDGALRMMNRRHDARQAELSVRQAQDAGFGNISIDLIFGIPGIPDAEWNDTLDKAVGLGVQHISAYHLTFEEKTPLGRLYDRGEVRPVDESVSESQYAILCRRLSGAGYDHYEISNFARPGYRSRHNSSYWSGQPYLGAGPSAHSFNGSQRRACAASIGTYLGKERYSTESLTADDRYNEYIMTSLRCREGADPQHIGEKFGPKVLEEFTERAEGHIAGGMLQYTDGRYALPEDKFLLSDQIIVSFFRT